MAVSLDKDSREPEVSRQTGLANSLNDGFRRAQMMLAVWAVVIIVGGWVHNTYARDLGAAGILLVWLGLVGAGLAVSFGLTRAFLSSGQLFVWGILLLAGMGITALIVFPLAQGGKTYVSSLWHGAFAVGYFLTGRFMDRRLWILAGWEVLMAGLILAAGPSPDVQNFIKTVTTLDPLKNQGLLLGLTTGIPLLLAALPVWKKRYGQ